MDRRCLPCRINEKVSVVILTKNRYDEFIRAINSVIRQDILLKIEIIVIGDNCEYIKDVIFDDIPKNINVKKINVYLDEKKEYKITVKRVATLRDIAIRLFEGEYVCFLDDDNEWEPYHLSSLLKVVNNKDYLAVYSWRKLYLKNRSPWIPDHWPWLGSDLSQKELLRIYQKIGMLRNNSNILKDNHNVIYNNKDFSTVDMGAWLFKREFFNHINFETCYSEKQVDRLVTEDDILLLDVKKNNIAVCSSEVPSLKYCLGGYSNAYNE